MTTEEKKTNKKRLFKILIALILIICVIILAQFAWAKYMTSLNGNSKADIAKWSFKVNKETNESFTINLSTTRGEKQEAEVQDGFIGPGTSGKFIIEVDATDTEVSLEYNINIAVDYNDNTVFPRNLIFYSDSEMKNAIYHTENGITLNGFIAQSDENKTIPHTIYWKWDFETGQTQTDKDKNDIADSYWIGQNISIPITVVGQQVNQNPNTNQYAVTFDANGGIIEGYGNSENMIKMVSYNEQYGKLPIPTREGYTFAGWTVGDLFDNSSILMEIPGATYQNGHYIFDAGEAVKKYKQGISQLGGFKDNTQYTVKVKGYSVRNNEYGQTVNYRMDFKYKGEDYIKHPIPLLNFNSDNEQEVIYTSEKDKTIEYILMTYGYTGTVYISDVRIEEGTISNPYYIEPSTIFANINSTKLKAEWAPYTNQ